MDKIYYNGKIYSIDEDNRIYAAMGIEGEKICFLGSDEEAQQIEAKERIDLRGNIVLPGFIDSHLHLLNYAFVSESYQMFGVNSIEEIIEEGRRLSGSMSGCDSSQWLYGRGWNHQNFSDEKRMLTRFDLDRITTERPVLFIRVCGHIAAVNSKGMDIVLSLPEAEDYMEQIDVEKGILTEASVKLCYNAMDKPSVSKIKEMIQFAQVDMNAKGITSVQSDNFLSLPGRDWRSIVKAHKELDEEGALTVRIAEQASFTAFVDLKTFIDEGYRTGQGSDYYKIGPVKLYEDGSLGAKTALLKEPYCGETTCGQMVHDEADLQRCVDYAYKNDMQILIHAIGDRASDLVCSAYEDAIAKYGKRESRLAINHLQIVSEGLFERMARNHILAFIQPVFVASDKNTIGNLVGKQREKLSYSWKTMMNAGLICCGSSDAPVESFDVLQGIEIAVTRDSLKEKTGGWHPEEKLTALEAVRLFTVNNAYGSFDEQIKGSLELGKLADLVILGADPFSVEPHAIADIPILATIVGGRQVYSAE